MNHYVPAQFEFETMNQKDFKPFRMTQRPQSSRPLAEPVVTQSFPKHFDTYNMKEYKAHKGYRVPDIDLIPYP